MAPQSVDVLQYRRNIVHLNHQLLVLRRHSLQVVLMLTNLDQTHSLDPISLLIELSAQLVSGLASLAMVQAMNDMIIAVVDDAKAEIEALDVIGTADLGVRVVRLPRMLFGYARNHLFEADQMNDVIERAEMDKAVIVIGKADAEEDMVNVIVTIGSVTPGVTGNAENHVVEETRRGEVL